MVLGTAVQEHYTARLCFIFTPMDLTFCGLSLMENIIEIFPLWFNLCVVDDIQCTS